MLIYICLLYINRIGKFFKMIDYRYDIGDCGFYGDFEICLFEMSILVIVLGCMVRFNLGFKINLIEKNINFFIFLVYK